MFKFVKYPSQGDIVLGRLTDQKVMFVTLESYDDSLFDSSLYEKIGVVGYRYGNEVKIIYKNNSANPWCNRAWWKLTGYTLDGTNRSGVLSWRFPSNSYNETISKTISYNASTIESFVSQLNSAFASDEDFTAIDTYATYVDGYVRIHCNNNDYRQLYQNSAGSGFSTSAMPEIPMLSSMRRVNGNVSGWGAIASWYRALAYYRNDNGTAEYQGGRTSVQTSIKQAFPINLPTWNGTSTKNPGDFCAYLRNYYGNGEYGWIRFMKSCLPVCPTDAYVMGQRDGLERTKQLASFTYTSSTVSTETPMCKAASYCYNIGTECIPQGNWYLPTPEDMCYILRDIQYGTSASRTSDPINEGLYKIGGSAISNSSDWWSCSRYRSSYAWYSNGSRGFFGASYMVNAFGCFPVTLYRVA